MNETDAADDRLLAPKTVADRLVVHVDTLKTWRSTWPAGACKGPRFVKLEGQVRYWESDVVAYLARNTVAPVAALA